MKIVDLQTILVKNNCEPPHGGRYWLFVKLVTDEGIVGLGECTHGQEGREGSKIQLLHDLARRFVIGRDPFMIEALWQDMYSRDHDYRHPGLLTTAAMSAIEMACWDIMGKALSQPVYNLLGGRLHDKLDAYSYMGTEGIWDDPDLAGEYALEHVERGNKAVKLDPFQPPLPAPREASLKEIDRAVAVFGAIRRAVGNDLEIAIGTHGQLTTSSAIRAAHALEEFSPFWFEEPVSHENVREMARVAAHTSIPIATGERRLTKYEFVDILREQAAQIIQMDVGHCGGILEAKKIAGMAEAHYATIAPHMYSGPVAAAAGIHVAACSPNFLILEFNTVPLHSEILTNPIRFEEGVIIPPDGPGLGVELDKGVLDKCRSDRNS
jgi:L-alanine-DL-glutamate epimerase-like enolase superfamily enzyme